MNVLSLFVVESAVVGLFGGLIGSLLGVAGAYGATVAYPYQRRWAYVLCGLTYPSIHQT